MGITMIDNATRTGNLRGGFTLLELIVVISVITALAAMGYPAYLSIKHKVDVSSTDTLVNSVATAIETYSTKTWTWNEGTPAAPISRMYHMFDLNHYNYSSGAPVEKPDLADAPKGGTKRYWSIDGYTLPEKSPYFTSPNTWADYKYPVAPDLDANGEGLFDGGFPSQVLASGYKGFVNMASPSVKKSFINKKGQIVDAWQRPLRIAFAAKVFGTQSFAVWSAGYDGKDSFLSSSTTFQDDPDRPNDDLRSWESSNGK
jgi:prepilin-type N-terminal cleavage/methylation domain-containing protein